MRLAVQEFFGKSTPWISSELEKQIRTVRWLERALFGLLIAYVLVFSVSYTFDYVIHTQAVVLLTTLRCISLFAACCYLYVRRNELLGALDPFAACFVLIIAVGAISGLYSEFGWFGYLRHGFQYALLLAFYLVGRVVGAKPVPAIVIKTLSLVAVAGYLIATILYFAAPGLHSGSYSFQPNLLLLPVSYGLSMGQPLLALVSSALVIIGNKRAVYLGLALVLAIPLALWLVRKQGTLQRIAVVCVAVPAIGFGLALLVSKIGQMTAVPVVSSVVDRFTVAPTFNGGSEVTAAKEATVDPVVRFTSARSTEAESVWEMERHGPAEFLFGLGLGSRFTVHYISPNDYKPVETRRDQADLAPVHVALTSGIPLAVLFTVLYCGMLLLVFLRISSADDTTRVLAIFSMGLFIDTMLGFNPSNPVTWVALGVISRQLLSGHSLRRDTVNG